MTLSETIKECLESGAGKQTNSAVYLHWSLVPESLKPPIEALVDAKHIANLGEVVVRVDRVKRTIAILHYEYFESVAHPGLCCSTVYEEDGRRRSHRTYPADGNRPIFHRKELAVGSKHSHRSAYEHLTAVEESHGLFADATRIGWSKQWTALLEQKGLRIEGHEVVVDGRRD